MSGNIVKLRLQEGRATTSSGLYQYDYGQKLVFTGAELPETYEVHFSNCQKGLSKTVLGTPEGADIPDEFLLSGEPVYVWVFLHDTESDGETEYEGVINVTKRARPSTIKARPVQQDIVTKTIAALNAGVETVKDIADDIQETAEEIHTIAEEMPQQIQDALQEAKDSGEFDGFSPIATVEKQDNVATITITDVNGTTTAHVSDGDPTNLIDDTAGPGITDKVWSADKTLDEIMAVSPVLPVFTMGEQNEVQCNMTFAEIAEAIQAGKCTMAAFGNEQFYYYLTLSSFAPNEEAVFSLLLGTGDGVISAVTIYYYHADSDVAMLMSNGITLQTFLAKNYTRITFPVKAGSYCFRDGQFYKAKQDIASYEDWNAAHWQATLIGNELVELDKNKAEQTELASAYSSSSTYAIGDYCTHDGGFYVCTTAISAAEAWTAAHWTAVTVGSELIKASSDSIVPMFSMGQSFGSLTCNMSFAEVSAAIIAKKCTSCLCGVVDNVLGFYLFNANGSKIVFATTIDISALGIPSVTNGLALYYITYNSDGTATLDAGGLSIESIAQDYSSLTFPIAAGTLCLYQDVLYKAKQDIQNREEWTYLHWQVTTVDEQLGLLQTNIDGKADKTDTVLNTTLSRGRESNSTIGNASMAFGVHVTASGDFSVALNDGCIASGESSVAEGDSCEANGYASHASGLATTANGDQSFAAGQFTQADGINQFVIGNRNIPSNTYPDWVANTSYNIGDKVTYSSNGYVCKTANQDATWKKANWTRLQSNSDNAFIIGNGSATNLSNAVAVDWDGNEYLKGDLYVHSAADSTGGQKVATETDLANKADKVDTVIENSLSMGRLAGSEVGQASVALGAGNTASGQVSVALGAGSTASGAGAISAGSSTASGMMSFANGMYSTASGALSYANGLVCTASNIATHAEGLQCEATGPFCHAEGGSTIANAMFMHAYGMVNMPDTEYPTWTANTQYEVGDKVVLRNDTGFWDVDNGYECITANSDETFTSSKWKSLNFTSVEKTAFVIGNGKVEIGQPVYSNAARIDFDGNQYLAGDIYIQSNAAGTQGTKLEPVVYATDTEVNNIISNWGAGA